MRYEFDIYKRIENFVDKSYTEDMIDLLKNNAFDIRFFPILGKTGAGKDTIVDLFRNTYMYDNNTNVEFLKQHTTRKQRNKDDNTYIFDEKLRKDQALDPRYYGEVNGAWYWFNVYDIINILESYKNDPGTFIKFILPAATVETVLQLKAFIRLISLKLKDTDFHINLDICPIYIERDPDDRYLSLMKRELQSDNPDLEGLLRRIENDEEDYDERYIEFIATARVFNEKDNPLYAVKQLIDIIF